MEYAGLFQRYLFSGVFEFRDVLFQVNGQCFLAWCMPWGVVGGKKPRAINRAPINVDGCPKFPGGGLSIATLLVDGVR